MSKIGLSPSSCLEERERKVSLTGQAYILFCPFRPERGAYTVL